VLVTLTVNTNALVDEDVTARALAQGTPAAAPNATVTAVREAEAAYVLRAPVTPVLSLRQRQWAADAVAKWVREEAQTTGVALEAGRGRVLWQRTVEAASENALDQVYPLAVGDVLQMGRPQPRQEPCRSASCAVAAGTRDTLRVGLLDLVALSAVYSGGPQALWPRLESVFATRAQRAAGTEAEPTCRWSWFRRPQQDAPAEPPSAVRSGVDTVMRAVRVAMMRSRAAQAVSVTVAVPITLAEAAGTREPPPQLLLAQALKVPVVQQRLREGVEAAVLRPVVGVGVGDRQRGIALLAELPQCGDGHTGCGAGSACGKCGLRSACKVDDDCLCGICAAGRCGGELQGGYAENAGWRALTGGRKEDADVGADGDADAESGVNLVMLLAGRGSWETRAAVTEAAGPGDWDTQSARLLSRNKWLRVSESEGGRYATKADAKWLLEEAGEKWPEIQW
jgi:hypothetical protein